MRGSKWTGVRLTKKKIERVSAPARGETILWDSEVRGLGVRVLPSGQRKFIVRARVGRGRKAAVIKPTIGDFGTLSLEAARTRARKIVATAKEGIDPIAEERAQGLTLNALAHDYLENHAKLHKRSWRGDKRILDLWILPELGTRLVASVTPIDCERLYKKVLTAQTPRRTKYWKSPKGEWVYAANRMVALLSKLFNRAIRDEIRPDNPCRGLQKKKEHRRERFLTMDELVRVARYLDSMRDEARNDIANAGRPGAWRLTPISMSADAIHLMILTGARRGEVFAATWGQFRLEDPSSALWIKPHSLTKTAMEHKVTLSREAVRLLLEIREARVLTLRKGRELAADDVLFPKATLAEELGYRIPPSLPAAIAPKEKQAQRNGPSYFKDFRRYWGRLVKDCQLIGVRPHDLRHSFASIAVSRGASLQMIGALLGHTQPGTTQRYAHLYHDPLRIVVGGVGEIFEAARRGQAATVLPLRARSESADPGRVRAAS